MRNKKIILNSRLVGMPSASNFMLVEDNLPPIGEGELLIGDEYISLDPAMRGWMNEGTTYIKGVELGSTMRTFAAGKVLESKHASFNTGDWVQGLTGVQQYAVSNGIGISKIKQQQFPLS